MEKKNNVFLICQTVIIILLIAVIVVLVIGKNKKESTSVANSDTKNQENVTEKTEVNDNSDNLSDVSNSSNSSINVYSSDDNKYYLILTEYPKKSLNPKSSNTTSKSFKVSIDEYYSISEFYGDYTIENNKIKLIVSSGCTATVGNGAFNCALPNGATAVSRNDGLNEIDLNYSEKEIMFGDVKLTLK